MKVDYITYFDCNFLPQGLVMIDSLFDKCEVNKLHIYALDELAFDYLLISYSGDSRVEVLLYSDYLDNTWNNLKKTRSKTEFIWSMTPLFISLTYKVMSADFLVYVDSDMYFLESDRKILKRFQESGKDAFITPHFYFGDYDYSKISGKYCVQYLIFKTFSSNDILYSWVINCKNECTSNVRPGGKGDQRYLTFWEELFPNRIYIAENLGEFVAPWNVYRDGVQNCIVYHFQGFRIVGNGFYIYNQSFFIPGLIKKVLYIKYSRLVNDYYQNLVGSGYLISKGTIRVYRTLVLFQLRFWFVNIYKSLFKLLSLNIIKY
jgi:hypothetical protein